MAGARNGWSKPETWLSAIVGNPDLSPDSGLPEKDDMAPASPAHPGEMPN